MNANVTKTNRGKLLAAVMAIFMVFMAVAIISSDNTTDAAWEMGGNIPTGNQTVAAGVDAVAISNFEITDGAIWTVKNGASFTVNEGVTVTISDGAQLNIENGALVVINGTLVIEQGSTLSNSTTMVGSTSGFIVNGTLEVDRGTISTYNSTDSDSGFTAPSDVTTSGLTMSALQPVGTNGESNLGTISGSSTNGVIKLTGSVAKHMNGAGTMGYWVGVSVSGIAQGDYRLTWSGSANSTTVGEDRIENFWVQAGGYYVITMTNTADSTQSYTFVIDATAVNSNDTAGEIYVNGLMTVDSNRNAPTSIIGQTIYVASGATADLNATFNSVVINAYAGSTNNPYTYGSVTVNTTGSTASNLTFTTTSERITSAYVVDNEGEATKTTRAYNYILNIDGDVEAGTELMVTDARAIAGAYSTLQYPNEDDDDANGVLMYGITSITGTLNVDGTLSAQSTTTINVSGTLNINGSRETPAKIDFRGTVNVSGTFAMDSIVGNDATVAAKSSIIFNGAYLSVSGEGRITIADAELDTQNLFQNVGINAAAYSNDDGLVIASIANVIAGATADNEDEIYIFGNDKSGVANPYIITADLTIEDNFNLTMCGRILVSEDVTLTFADGSSVEAHGSDAMLIIVEGTVIDYNLEEFTYSETPANSLVIDAEVMFTDEEGDYNMYTSLAESLSGTPGTVVLFGNVEIEGTVTIPEGFVIDQNTNDRTITINNNSTLIVNGTIVSGENQIIVSPEVEANQAAGISAERAGTLTVNNMIVDPNIVMTDVDTYRTAGFSATGTIGDYENSEFLLAPEVAASNAGTLYDIASQGDVSYGGSLVFTASEDNEGDTITLAGGDVIINDITVSGFAVNVTATSFTGTVQMSVTAGDSAVEFNEATGYTLTVSEDTSGEEDVTIMNISVLVTPEPSGGVIIAAGSVSLSGNATFGATSDDVLTVADGATLVIPRGSGLQLANLATGVAGANTDYAALAVEGTITIEEGAGFGYSGTSGITTIIQVDGTMNLNQDVTLSGEVHVDGTMNIADECEITVAGTVYVTGTVSGATGLSTVSNFIIAYAGSAVDVENMGIQPNGTSNVDGIGVYLNGELYLTVYARDNTNVYTAIQAGEYELQGYQDVNFPGDAGEDTIWYTNSEYTTELNKDRAIASETPAVYAKLNPLSANVTISIGQGMSVYIDGVRVDYGELPAPYDYVGDHTVEVTINPGYSGEVTITFNGQTIQNGGTFTITPQMAGANADQVVLSVTGNISVDSGITSGGSSDGMGLTDYLLIILVVLIVIMAIMVAMRLMRS